MRPRRRAKPVHKLQAGGACNIPPATQEATSSASSSISKPSVSSSSRSVSTSNQSESLSVSCRPAGGAGLPQCGDGAAASGQQLRTHTGRTISASPPSTSTASCQSSSSCDAAQKGTACTTAGVVAGADSGAVAAPNSISASSSSSAPSSRVSTSAGNEGTRASLQSLPRYGSDRGDGGASAQQVDHEP